MLGAAVSSELLLILESSALVFGIYCRGVEKLGFSFRPDAAMFDLMSGSPSLRSAQHFITIYSSDLTQTSQS